MTRITPQTFRVLQAIGDLTTELGQPPTGRLVAARCDCSHQNAHCGARVLQAAGLLHRPRTRLAASNYRLTPAGRELAAAYPSAEAYRTALRTQRARAALILAEHGLTGTEVDTQGRTARQAILEALSAGGNVSVYTDCGVISVVSCEGSEGGDVEDVIYLDEAKAA